jgi:hypothetical protein
MEEVVGSIPTRSTKSLNGLAPITILVPAVLTCDFLPVLPVFTCVHCIKRDSNFSSAARFAGS